MVERLDLQQLETVEPVLGGAEITYLQCTALGWTDLEINRVCGLNPEKVKDGIADKMLADTTYDERLARLKRLPFVSENFLSPTEGVVAFLVQSGFKNSDIVRTTGLDSSNVSGYRKKIENKKCLKRDEEIPAIVYSQKPHKVGLIKGLHYALDNELIDTSLIQTQPNKALSYSEAKTLLYVCWGLTISEISKLTNDNSLTVETYYKRGKKKMGVSTKTEYIACGVVEIIRLTRE